MVIRPAAASDLDGVSAVYEAIHDAETAHGRGSGSAGKTYRLRKRARCKITRSKKAPVMPERAWLVLLFALSCRCEKTVINAEPV